MNELVTALLAAGMLVAAFAYASVGHGGASAYIAKSVFSSEMLTRAWAAVGGRT